ncbi:hypothetical protein [Romboutsia sp. MSSM.1001216sp_RTP31141st1_F12_RTP31141_220114]|uniref:hypothetical protein n=2 Tax=unclassified Romboutsia TaxID=2626894 RepID=UPI0031B5FA95
MNSRASLVVLLLVLIASGFYIAIDSSKDKVKNKSETDNTNVIQQYSLKEKNNTLDKKQIEDKKNIEVIKDFAKENSLSDEENNNIKNTVEAFLKAFCSISEGSNPRTRLESVKASINPSLYEELNKQIDVESNLATEYYVYRNINKIVIHNIQKKENEVSVSTSVFSDWINNDLSTQIEDAPQDYTLTLTKENSNWIINSFVENFK